MSILSKSKPGPKQNAVVQKGRTGKQVYIDNLKKEAAEVRSCIDNNTEYNSKKKLVRLLPASNANALSLNFTIAKTPVVVNKGQLAPGLAPNVRLVSRTEFKKIKATTDYEKLEYAINDLISELGSSTEFDQAFEDAHKPSLDVMEKARTKKARNK